MLVFEKRENYSTLTERKRGLDQAYQLLKATAVFNGIKIISRTCNKCISTFYIFMVVFLFRLSSCTLYVILNNTVVDL